MFSNLGPTEFIITALILVLLFGAKKIPELAQGIGKGLREFKKAVKDEENNSDDNKKAEK
jgi:sec-independent protein translocase protein TatA